MDNGRVTDFKKLQHRRITSAAAPSTAAPLDPRVQVLFNVISIIILLIAFVVRIPQIAKIYRAKSAAGVTKVGIAMEVSASSCVDHLADLLIMQLAAFTLAIAYPFSMRDPFITFGEFVFLSAQTAIILGLLLYYDELYTPLVGCLLVYVVGTALLCSGLLGKATLNVLQIFSVAFSLAGRGSQAIKNCAARSTGQLSQLTM